MRQIEIISCIADKTWVNEVIDAGADALYCGLMNKSWFNTCIELTWEELLEVSEVVHRLGKKIYLAINRNLSTEDVDEVSEYIAFFENGTFDGVILSDWGCINALRKLSTKIHIHLSANTGCVNEWDFKLAQEMKVQRIIFSPSLDYEYISSVIERYKGFEWEAITYGMQCMNEVGYCPCHASFSGATFDNVCCHSFGLYNEDQLITEERPYGNSVSNGSSARKLYELGVNHFKLEGRSKGLKHIEKGTRILRNIADNIQE